MRELNSYSALQGACYITYSLINSLHLHTMASNIRLSASAYEGLCSLVAEYEFNSTKNISRFLTICAIHEADFVDTRPAHIREIYANANSQSPPQLQVWSDGADKHYFCIGNLPTDYLIAIAEQYHIPTFREQRPLLAGTPVKATVKNTLLKHLQPARITNPTPNARSQPVLEAIGIGWLTLSKPLPASIAPGSRHRRNKAKLVLIGA